MKSRYGVYYDLSQSPHSVTAEGICFYFSSLLHLQAFLDKKTGTEKRYGLNTRFEFLQMVRDYQRIETRGFYITVEGVSVSCPDQLIFTDRVQVNR